mgnify:FL=1
MREHARHIISMITGIVVALAIICSQLFHTQQDFLQKKETKTEQHQEDDSDDQVYITVTSTSLPSSAYTELHPTVFFLFDILLEERVSGIPEFIVSIPSGQFFRTIFGLIISPNAP